MGISIDYAASSSSPAQTNGGFLLPVINQNNLSYWEDLQSRQKFLDHFRVFRGKPFPALPRTYTAKKNNRVSMISQHWLMGRAEE